jgi:ABC-type multidrug transport system ATPase subunit
MFWITRKERYVVTRITHKLGKTLLINVLCKIAHADSGTITINYLSLDEAYKQHLVALCPQFDILFDD